MSAKKDPSTTFGFISKAKLALFISFTNDNKLNRRCCPLVDGMEHGWVMKEVMGKRGLALRIVFALRGGGTWLWLWSGHRRCRRCQSRRTGGSGWLGDYPSATHGFVAGSFPWVRSLLITSRWTRSVAVGVLWALVWDGRYRGDMLSGRRGGCGCRKCRDDRMMGRLLVVFAYGGREGRGGLH